MDLTIPWIIARKELHLIRRRRVLLVSFFLFPLAIAVPLPLLIYAIASEYSIPMSQFVYLFGPLQFLFADIAFALPLITATYSIAGEKLEQTLEPLLATSAKDQEILFGKDLGTMIPSMLSIISGALVYMGLTDALTYGSLGYLVLPTASFALTILVVAPLSAYLITRLSILFSARSKSVQSAQAYGRILLIAFLSPIWLNFLGIFSVTSLRDLLLIALIMLIAGFVTSRKSSAVFRRDQILTRWK